MVTVSLEGQSLGKYRVMEPLGHGGMARVYRAYHPQLDRYVAIKVLRSDLIEDEEFLARFRREAQAVAALRHSNIVQVFDFDVEDDIYYMVMELLEGDTLKTRLNDYRIRGERMALGEMVRVLLDVLDGLDYAHGEGMIHRDIKPANVLLTRRGQAVIADFGIARIVGSTRHTMSGALMGTLDYMAPEQGMAGTSDARSDIYSLGIMFYEMLTQRPPFEADTPLAVLMKHVNDPLLLPRKVDPTIPEPFERIVLKALAKDPDDRYQSAGEMAHALREAADAAEIALPTRISLPLSFTTTDAPSESVAIFSGTARERITDAEFAADDTDVTLSQRLAAEQAEAGQALGAAGKELMSAVGALGQVFVGKTAKAIRDVADAVKDKSQDVSTELREHPSGVPPKETSDEHATKDEVEAEKAAEQPLAAQSTATAKTARQTGKERHGNVRRAIVNSILLLIAGNLFALWVAIMFDAWDIFEGGWPMELCLAGFGLAMIMHASGSIWMLIPTGIVLGNSVIFSYFSLTDQWDDWAFLWPLEAFVVIGAIWLPILLSGRGKFTHRISRLLAWTLELFAMIWSVVFTAIGLGFLVLNW